MNKKTIPWWTPQICGNERKLVEEVLESNYINDGQVTRSFEKKIAGLLGVKHVVAVPSGTAAITAALRAVGVRAGDEVIVPDITFIATANAASILGAHPILVDVDERTLNMCPEAMQKAITPRTRAIVPVHVSGRGAAMEEIVKIAGEHGIPVVEDAAEAFLSRYHGRNLGTFGIAGCFSLSPNKTITTGQGGMVVTNDDALIETLRELKDQGRPRPGTGGDDVHNSAGFNFKFTNLQAAVGIAQLECLAARMERMRSIYRIYAGRLKNVEGVRLPGFDVDNGECPQWTDAVIEQRDDLDVYLQSQDIHCRRFWFPIHSQAPYRLPDDRFPVSTQVTRKAIWLPSAFTMTEADAELVCEQIIGFLTNRSARPVFSGSISA
jgi:perosamine synthetase